MYTYFAAKEDLFLELLLPDSEAWERGAAEHFGPRVWDPREFAKEWTDVCLPHERMLQLLAIRYAVPEKNCSLQGLSEFKATIRGIRARLRETLRRALGFPAEAEEFLFARLALLTGPGLARSDGPRGLALARLPRLGSTPSSEW